MFCKKCGAEIQDDALICTKCGSATENYDKKIGGSSQAAGESTGLAIGALISAFFVPIVGLILGIVALVKAKKGEAGGKGMAIAAIVISAIETFALILVIIIHMTILGGFFNAVNQTVGGLH